MSATTGRNRVTSCGCWTRKGELSSFRLPEGIEGLAQLHGRLARFATDPYQVVVGIETDRGLWVQALVASGYLVYPINPKAVARYRDRHHVGGGKSDPGDAKVLADLVRTDRHNHRLLAGDSPEAEAIKLWARTHQRLCWDREAHVNRLRAGLREYYPAALSTFPDLDQREALAVLAIAPTPAEGKRLTTPRVRAALAKAGRQRSLEIRAKEIRAGLRVSHLEAPAPIVSALASATRAEVGIISELSRQIDALGEEMEDRFREHPDAAIYLSLPGIGAVLGARMLGELGDDPTRYPEAKSRRNYAGTSPLTIASGKRRQVVSRHVCNRWLQRAALRWAFCSLTKSPGCQSFYRHRLGQGDDHFQALRALANRLVSILHGCLANRTLYDEEKAWGHRHEEPGRNAA